MPSFKVSIFEILLSAKVDAFTSPLNSISKRQITHYYNKQSLIFKTAPSYDEPFF